MMHRFFKWPFEMTMVTTGNLSGHTAPTQVSRDALPKTSSRWSSCKGRNPQENRMRVATAFDVRRSRGGSSLIGKAAAVRLTGQNVRGHNTEAGKADSVHEGAAAPSHLPDGNVVSDKRRVGD